MIDPAVTALAATQHGLLSRAQLIELGIPRRRWRRAIEEGWLSVAGRGVYALAGSPESLIRRLWLGLLVLGPTAVVSHEAAAWLHGFDRCVDDRAEFTVPRALRSAGVGLVVHSTRSLPAVDGLMWTAWPVRPPPGRSSTSPPPASPPAGWKPPSTPPCAPAPPHRLCSSAGSNNGVDRVGPARRCSSGSCPTRAATRRWSGGSWR